MLSRSSDDPVAATISGIWQRKREAGWGRERGVWDSVPAKGAGRESTGGHPHAICARSRGWTEVATMGAEDGDQALRTKKENG